MRHRIHAVIVPSVLSTALLFHPAELAAQTASERQRPVFRRAAGETRARQSPNAGCSLT